MPSTSTSSLLNNPDPLVRRTYYAHLGLYVLSAPFQAMILYAPFLAVKTFGAAGWAPALTAIIPASHLLAVFFAGAIERGDKTKWVVRPLVAANLIFALMIGVSHEQGWVFALVLICSQAFRAPMISAQSAIFRANYPPELRSFALSVPYAVQMAATSAYAQGCGLLFDKSEKWVVPAFLFAAVCGIGAAFVFRGVRLRPAAAPPAAAPAKGFDFAGQARTLMSNRGYLIFQASYMLFGAGSIAITAVLPFYLESVFMATHHQASMATNVIPMFTMALTMPLWGKILDRSNPLVMRALTTGIWSFTPLLLIYARSLEAVYTAQFLQGLVMSGSTLLWWLGINYFARPHEVARLMSIHQTLTGVRGATIPFLATWMGHRFGYRASMWLWFSLMLMGFALMVDEVLRERRKKGGLGTFSEREADMEPVPAADPE